MAYNYPRKYAELTEKLVGFNMAIASAGSKPPGYGAFPGAPPGMGPPPITG